MTDLSDNERLLIKLDEQLKNTNENLGKMMELTSDIFNKIDDQSKNMFDIKNKVETLKEITDLKFSGNDKKMIEFLGNVNQTIDSIKQTNELKFKESCKDTTDITSIIKANKLVYDDFVKNEFRPISDDIQKAKGALTLIKYVYPAIAIILQIVSVLISVHFGGK